MSEGLADGVDRFLANLRNERRLSPHTSSSYGRDLAALLDYCEAQGVATWTALDTQRDYLFGADGSQVGSTVLIPLGERAGLGLLAIASHDTERYLPTMSTDFLVRIGEIVSEAIVARGA